MSDTRKQINFRVSDKTLDLIDSMRSRIKPVPNVSELMHLALAALERELPEDDRLEVHANGNGNGVHHDVLDATTIRLAHVR